MEVSFEPKALVIRKDNWKILREQLNNSKKRSPGPMFKNYSMKKCELSFNYYTNQQTCLHMLTLNHIFILTVSEF